MSVVKKIVMLAPASVIHTQRWVEGLHSRGVSVLLATQHPADDWQPPEGVHVVVLPHRGTKGYFLNVRALRWLLREEQPDLLSVHYASGYGTTAALVGFRPWLLSVWGSDVYDFPYEGRIKNWLLCRNLRMADAIASTSEAMAVQVRRLVPDLKSLSVTPFGIDTAQFAPRPVARSGVVIGTVKTLAPKYGVDILIRAFALLVANEGRAVVASQRLSLVIVGGGPQRAALERLAAALGVAGRVNFAGAVPHAVVPSWLNGFDIYAAVSRLDSESFGVAALEASACALPVVVSDAGGLPEVIQHERTGIVVPRDDVVRLAQALQSLIVDPVWREQLGAAGRERVLKTYEWRHSIDRMLACCEATVSRHLATPTTPGGHAT